MSRLNAPPGVWSRGVAALFHRPSSREPVLDGVRAIAVMWVLILHIAFFHFGTFPDEVQSIFKGTMTKWIARGDLGVDLFFVISGFLIGGILLHEFSASGRIQLRRFYGRRFLRLTPVYAIVILMGFYFLRNIPREAILADINPSGNVENAWANLLYVNNFLSVREQYMGWCWSLAIEEQFYLLAPILLLFLLPRTRHPLAWMTVGFLASGFIRLGLLRYYDIAPPYDDTPDAESWVRRFDLVYIKPYARYGGLLLGVMGAHVSMHHAESLKRGLSSPRLTNLIVACGFIVFAYFACLSFRSDWFVQLRNQTGGDWAGQLIHSHHRDAFALATIALILAAIHGTGVLSRWLRRLLSARWLFPIAQLSYSTYLLHEMYMLWLFPKLAPTLVSRFGIGAHAVLAIDGAIVTLLTLGSSAVLFILIEHPCMEIRRDGWFRRMTGDRMSAAPQPVSGP